MRRPYLNALLIGGLLAALGAGIGLSHWLQQQDGAPDLAGLILPQAREIGDFSLTNQHGQPYDRAAGAGRWQLLFFGFTHCPDICPNTLAIMKALKQELPAPVAEQLDLVFVSVDPERDSIAVLRDYLAYFDPAFVGVTGSPDALTKFAEQLGIAFMRNGEGDDYTVDHSAALVLLDPQVRIKAYFSAPHSVASLSPSLSHLISP